jgi:hypothetical protein
VAKAKIVNDPGLAFVPADAKAAWTREPGPARAGYANVAEFLRRYSEAGGKVLAATDTGIPPIVPGLSLHEENADARRHRHSTDEGHSGSHQLFEQGRKASLLAGGDGRGTQTITMQVPASRLHLVTVDAEGVAR